MPSIVADSPVLDALRRTSAMLEGHFELSSGLHSSRYIQCAMLLQYPLEAEIAGRRLADKVRGLGATVVVGPALGGIVIAHEVARALGLRCLFTERALGGSGGREGAALGQAQTMRLRRGFTLSEGERVLIVEDVITTGHSAGEVADLLEALGGDVVGRACIVDRSGSKGAISLVPLVIDAFAPPDCPLCADGVPVDKPGSRTSR